MGTVAMNGATLRLVIGVRPVAASASTYMANMLLAMETLTVLKVAMGRGP